MITSLHGEGVDIDGQKVITLLCTAPAPNMVLPWARAHFCSKLTTHSNTEEGMHALGERAKKLQHPLI